MKVAVVGSGVSGLAATWLLNEHSDHEVHLYESDSRPGGHANTVRFQPEGADGVDVDTGFIVFNPRTYPNFLRFLRLFPSIPIQRTEMTFSVSRDDGAFEWAGRNLLSVFCQPWRLLEGRMWRMIYDVVRFNACAARIVVGDNGEWLLGEDPAGSLSIGEYLEKEGYSDGFRDDYLIPMTAAIWSTPPDKCALDFPARTLIQFMHNHHLLQITGKPKWLTIPGGSRQYVKQILSKLPSAQLHLSNPVTSVSSVQEFGRTTPKIHLKTADGGEHTFDHVIMACHSDTTLSILRAGGSIGGITQDEEDILGAFEWNKNEAVLHCDVRLMPKSRLAWSCWNYLTRSVKDQAGALKPNVDQVALTYGMNELQHISEKQHGPVLVTLNPPFEPDPSKTFGRYQYEHPVLDTKAIQAQRRMHHIQATRSISYAGAWTKYGFHEDGFTSGLLAALTISSANKEKPDALSVRPPFQVFSADTKPRITSLATWFEWFERLGLRGLVGWFGCIWLGWLRFIVQMAGFGHVFA